MFRRGLSIGASIAGVGLLAFGLASKAPNKGVDESLANGIPAQAPKFELPGLYSDDGAIAPSFELSTLRKGAISARLARTARQAFADGQLSLSELHGTPLVINFWASWCHPCREEAPVLQRGWQRDGKRGVLYLGLDMQDNSEDARSFLSEFGISYPTVRDTGDDVARSFGATGIPETYFLDHRGKVVGHAVGVLNPTLLAAGVRGALSGKVVGRLAGS